MSMKTTSSAVALGRRIQIEREAAGMSVRQLARLMAGDDDRRFETMRRYLARWEHGHNTPDESHRNAVADALGISRATFRLDGEATEHDIYQPLLRAIQSLVDRGVSDRLRALESATLDLSEVSEVDQRLIDAVDYATGRVLIAKAEAAQGDLAAARMHLGMAEARLSAIVEELRAAA